MIKDSNISDKKMLLILQKMRQKWGRKIITPNIAKILVKRKTIMDQFFTCKLLTPHTDQYFMSKSGKSLSRYVVYCHDLPGLIAWKKILEGEEESEYMNIIGLDDGKSLLKICWNWSKSTTDLGKVKLMGPKKSLGIVMSKFDIIMQCYTNKIRKGYKDIKVWSSTTPCLLPQ